MILRYLAAVFGFCALALGAVAQTGGRDPGAQRSLPPPNIVLFLVDDLGWADLGCQGSQFYETPRIDALAAEGIRFTQAYAACAVCSPTRAAVMTGRYPARIGVTDWIRARFQRKNPETPAKTPTEYVGGPARRLLCPPNPYWMEHGEVTIAEILRSVGYATCHVGKWHLGDDAWYPEQQGFDENHGGCDFGQPPRYFDPYRTKRLPGGIPTLAPRRGGEYLTDREADEAADFIRRNAKRPFFLHFAPYAVHTPIQAKAELTRHYESKPKTEQKNAVYAAMIHSVDDAVGQVVDALKSCGVADRTLVVFTSDNGGLRGPTHNGPLRSGKGFPYEGGIRVPLLMRWPAVIPKGSVSATPVCSVDLLPTVLEAVGKTPPPGLTLDGVSLGPHLRTGGTAPLDREMLIWHFPHYRGGNVVPYSIIRADPWKLIKWYEGPTFELYDLEADPGESRDVAKEHPERVRRLDGVLGGALARMQAKLPRANPAHRPPPKK